MGTNKTEFEKLLKLFKKLHLIPADKLVEALKKNLSDVSHLKVAPLPKQFRSDYSADIVQYIYIVKEKNIAILDIRNVRNKTIFYFTLGHYPHCFPYWTPKDGNNGLTGSLTDHLEELRFFLINGKLKDESKYDLRGEDGPNPYWDNQLKHSLKNSVGL